MGGALPALAASFALLGVGGAGGRSDAVRDGATVDRYSLVNGCYQLQLSSRQQLGPFRMQATALGQYLLYGVHQDFLGPGLAMVSAPSLDRLESAQRPSVVAASVRDPAGVSAAATATSRA